jgi:hypothetical protein
MRDNRRPTLRGKGVKEKKGGDAIGRDLSEIPRTTERIIRAE